MKIIDLTHSISANMPVYPGTESPVILTGCSIDEAGFLEKKITMYSHTGTHMDAPAHLIEQGKYLDQFSVEHFYGKAFVLHRGNKHARRIELDEFLPHAEQLARADFVLLHTGWDEYWGDEKYFSAYPVLSGEAAIFLGTLPLKGLGVDTISVDAIETKHFPIHMELLSKNIILIENLTNLEKISGSQCTFSCFPLKIVEADGSPVRAVAII